MQRCCHDVCGFAYSTPFQGSFAFRAFLSTRSVHFHLCLQAFPDYSREFWAWHNSIVWAKLPKQMAINEYKSEICCDQELCESSVGDCAGMMRLIRVTRPRAWSKFCSMMETRMHTRIVAALLFLNSVVANWLRWWLIDSKLQCRLGRDQADTTQTNIAFYMAI